MRPNHRRPIDPAAASGGGSLTLDESGAAVAYAFTVAGQANGTLTVTAKPGNASIQTYTDVTDVTLIGTDFADTFAVDYTAGAADRPVTIRAGDGNDLVSVRLATMAPSSPIDVHAGTGDDMITTYGQAVLIDGGDGDDSWTNFGYKAMPSSTLICDESGIIADGRAITSVETIGYHSSALQSTFSLSGRFDQLDEHIFFSREGGGGQRGEDPTFVLTTIIDCSEVTSGLTIRLTGNSQHHFRSSIDVELSVGDFSASIYFSNESHIVGTDHDDTFTFSGFPGNPGFVIDFDAGAGQDLLSIFAYADESTLDDEVFIVRPDGTATGNMGEYRNFERYIIEAGYDCYLSGGDADDRFTAGGQLFGKGGDDYLCGDYMDGGAGNDTLVGGGSYALRDTAVYADATQGVVVRVIDGAQDTVGAGIDTFRGINSLIGSAFADALTGDAKANTIEGGDGDDALDGGEGVDTASYASATAGVRVDLSATGTQNTRGAGVDTLTAFENLLGSAFDDVLVGTANDNVFDGGGGRDTVSYRNADAAVTVNLVTTAAQATGSGNDTLTSIENLIGSRFNDRLAGDFGDNVLEGGEGDDRLDGGDGFDLVSYAGAAAGVTADLRIAGAQDTRGAGADTLTAIEGLVGSAHADTLFGNGGDNLLDGGAGADRMTGGFGHDTLVGGAGRDTAAYATFDWTRYDVVADDDGYTVFNRANGDRDTLSSVERIAFTNGTFATSDTVNVGPRAQADTVRGLKEAGADGPGHSAEAGNVLNNDHDANLRTAGLGETLEVVGIASGRSADFHAVGQSATIQGRFGALTIHDDGTFDYQLDNARPATDHLKEGQLGREVFSYQIADAHGATDTATLTLAITGADDASAASGWHPIPPPIG